MIEKRIYDESCCIRKSETHILFIYLMSKDITPISGTTSQEHMQQDLDVGELSISNDEIHTITSLLND
jgi:diketogulonate reductase-like aldo/keto reductase